MRFHPQAVTFLACPQKNSAINVVHQLLGNLSFISLQYATSADAGGWGSSPKKKKNKTDDAADDARRQFAMMPSPSLAGKASEDSDDESSNESSNGDKKMKPEDLHTNNPLDWVDGPFRHSDEVKEDVSSLFKEGIDKEDYGNQDLHSSGTMYLMSYDQVQNTANQNKLLSGFMSELMDLITKKGFDVNRLSDEVISELSNASRRHFKSDYGSEGESEESSPDGNVNDAEKEGSVYLKFIQMSVREWIGACTALLKGPKKKCTGNHRVFVKNLRSKLEYGVENKWWGINETYSVPYIGESSAQSFSERMSDRYPTLFYAFSKHPAKRYEFKVGSVCLGNSKQSRAMEAFIATLLSLTTMRSRRQLTTFSEDDKYVSCLCLMRDCSAFNNIICGEQMWWRGGGNKINVFLRKNTQRYRNTLVLDCPQRELHLINYVFSRANEICHYINTTPREDARSEHVRDNTGAPVGERKSRNDLTVEDVSRYWGWYNANKLAREGRGFYDPNLRFQQSLEKLEEVFALLKEAYEDDRNHHLGYFFPPTGSRLYTRFQDIRRGSYDNAAFGLDSDSQRDFFLDKKDYEIKHLLYAEDYKEAREMKWDSVKFGDDMAVFMQSLPKPDPASACYSDSSEDS